MRNLAPLFLIVTGCITEPGLFIDKTGEGDGRIVSDPAGLDCGKQCGALVNGPVTLVATPDEHSVFVGWDGGACSGVEPCTVDIATETTVEAKFALLYHTLTITPDPHGRVDAIRIECGGLCTASYLAGMTVQLTAVPARDYLFVAWSDGNDTNPRLFTINEPATLAAVYELKSSLTVNIPGLGLGRVTSTPAGISCGTGLSNQCTAAFPRGTTVTLTAEPVQPYDFSGWQGCTPVEGTPRSCVIDVAGPVVAAATFVVP